MIKLVTDTTAVLSREYCQQHDIDVVPQIIRFGEETFLEGVEMDEPTFLQRLKSSEQLPATAAPAPGLFDDTYRQAAEKGYPILSIHPSTEVSGTVASANVARNLYPHADIRVFDMRTVAGCLGEAVKLAVEWRDAGRSVDQIEADLRRNGRIGGASNLIGSVLQIKPILQISGGRVEPLDKVRTHQKALERLKELVLTECPRGPEARLSVMHADALHDADRLRAELSAALNIKDIPLYSVGPAITTHGGPGILAVGFFAAP
jgi:fatty acid-binding protein DegV